MKTVSDVYPSEWLHAANLMGRSVEVAVSAIEVREFRQQDGSKANRIVVTFKGAQRRLVCNKTPAIALAAIAGTEEFAKWVGLKVLLSPSRTRNGQETIVIGQIGGME